MTQTAANKPSSDTAVYWGARLVAAMQAGDKPAVRQALAALNQKGFPIRLAGKGATHAG
jgi:hypothetical protein